VITKGSYRFKILDADVRDGYKIGKIERFDDISSSDELLLQACAPLRSEESIQQPEPRASLAHLANSIASGSSPAHTRAHRSSSSTSEQAIDLFGSPASSPTLSDSPSPSSHGEASNSAHRNRCASITTEQTSEALMERCHRFIDRINEKSPFFLERARTCLGDMPEDIPSFSYWMAMVVPVEESEKVKLLPLRSARLRLRLIVHWLDQLEDLIFSDSHAISCVS